MSPSTGTLITDTGPSGLRPLGAFGKPVYLSHLQIRSVLQSQPDPALRHYLATPVSRGPGTDLMWTSDLKGPVRRMHELPDQELGREKVRALTQQLADLVSRLRHGGSNGTAAPGAAATAGGGAAAALASVLDQARQVPAPGDYLYFVGDQPVLAWWGFEDPAQTPTADPLPPLSSALPGLPALPAVPPEPAPAAPPPTPASRVPGTGPIGVAPVAAIGRPWWHWLLGLLLGLLLLLLILGLFRSCSAGIPGWGLPGFGLPSVNLPGLNLPDANLPSLPNLPGLGSGGTPGAQAPEKSLDIPKGALEKGDLSFLDGNWQLGEGRYQVYRGKPENIVGSGRNLLSFDRSGAGTSSLVERRAHGADDRNSSQLPDCSGPARAMVEGARLIIEQSPCGGQNQAPMRHECRRLETGITQCETVNEDGHRWDALLKKME